MKTCCGYSLEALHSNEYPQDMFLCGELRKQFLTIYLILCVCVCVKFALRVVRGLIRTGKRKGKGAGDECRRIYQTSIKRLFYDPGSLTLKMLSVYVVC